MSTPKYQIIWRVNGKVEARDTMVSWLGVQLLRAFAVTVSFFDSDRHQITVQRIK